MPNAVDTFMEEIGQLETALFKDLSKIAKGLDKLTDTELIRVIRELNLFQDLLDRGYINSVNGLMTAYEGQLSGIAKEAVKRGINPIKGATVQQLEFLQELDTRKLLGTAEAFSNELTSGLFQGIVAGESPSSIVARLSETINLQTHQLNVAVHDGIRQFDNTARMKVFEGEDVKWIYNPGAIPTTRDICLEALSAGVVTEAERNSLSAGGSDRGGFNCRHDWLVV